MRGRRSDSALLASADPDDFERFYHRHVDVVTAYVRRRVLGRENGFDVVAETFARALATREQYDPDRGPAIAWLLIIARSVIIDTARRGRVVDETRRRLQMQPIDLDDADLIAIQQRTGEPLLAALDELPTDQRIAVRRRVLNEEPYPTIAADVGTSEQVVRQRVRRGLLRLRRHPAAEDAR